MLFHENFSKYFLKRRWPKKTFGKLFKFPEICEKLSFSMEFFHLYGKWLFWEKVFWGRKTSKGLSHAIQEWFPFSNFQFLFPWKISFQNTFSRKESFIFFCMFSQWKWKISFLEKDPWKLFHGSICFPTIQYWYLTRNLSVICTVTPSDSRSNSASGRNRSSKLMSYF